MGAGASQTILRTTQTLRTGVHEEAVALRRGVEDVLLGSVVEMANPRREWIWEFNRGLQPMLGLFPSEAECSFFSGVLDEFAEVAERLALQLATQLAMGANVPRSFKKVRSKKGTEYEAFGITFSVTATGTDAARQQRRSVRNLSAVCSLLPTGISVPPAVVCEVLGYSVLCQPTEATSEGSIAMIEPSGISTETEAARVVLTTILKRLHLDGLLIRSFEWGLHQHSLRVLLHGSNHLLLRVPDGMSRLPSKQVVEGIAGTMAPALDRLQHMDWRPEFFTLWGRVTSEKSRDGRLWLEEALVLLASTICFECVAALRANEQTLSLHIDGVRDLTLDAHTQRSLLLGNYLHLHGMNTGHLGVLYSVIDIRGHDIELMPSIFNEMVARTMKYLFQEHQQECARRGGAGGGRNRQLWHFMSHYCREPRFVIEKLLPTMNVAFGWAKDVLHAVRRTVRAKGDTSHWIFPVRVEHIADVFTRRGIGAPVELGAMAAPREIVLEHSHIFRNFDWEDIFLRFLILEGVAVCDRNVLDQLAQLLVRDVGDSPRIIDPTNRIPFARTKTLDLAVAVKPKFQVAIARQEHLSQSRPRMDRLVVWCERVRSTMTMPWTFDAIVGSAIMRYGCMIAGPARLAILNRAKFHIEACHEVFPSFSQPLVELIRLKTLINDASGSEFDKAKYRRRAFAVFDFATIGEVESLVGDGVYWEALRAAHSSNELGEPIECVNSLLELADELNVNAWTQSPNAGVSLQRLQIAGYIYSRIIAMHLDWGIEIDPDSRFWKLVYSLKREGVAEEMKLGPAEPLCNVDAVLQNVDQIAALIYLVVTDPERRLQGISPDAALKAPLGNEFRIEGPAGTLVSNDCVHCACLFLEPSQSEASFAFSSVRLIDASRVEDSFLHVIRKRMELASAIQVSVARSLTLAAIVNACIRLPALREIDFSYNEMMDDNTLKEILSVTKTLKKLCVRGCVRLTDEFKYAVYSCTELSALDCSECVLVTDVAVSGILASCGKLEDINFSSCSSIGDITLFGLASRCGGDTLRVHPQIEDEPGDLKLWVHPPARSSSRIRFESDANLDFPLRGKYPVSSGAPKKGSDGGDDDAELAALDQEETMEEELEEIRNREYKWVSPIEKFADSDGEPLSLKKLSKEERSRVVILIFRVAARGRGS